MSFSSFYGLMNRIVKNLSIYQYANTMISELIKRQKDCVCIVNLYQRTYIIMIIMDERLRS